MIQDRQYLSVTRSKINPSPLSRQEYQDYGLAIRVDGAGVRALEWVITK